MPLQTDDCNGPGSAWRLVAGTYLNDNPLYEGDSDADEQTRNALLNNIIVAIRLESQADDCVERGTWFMPEDRGESSKWRGEPLLLRANESTGNCLKPEAIKKAMVSLKVPEVVTATGISAVSDDLMQEYWKLNFQIHLMICLKIQVVIYYSLQQCNLNLWFLCLTNQYFLNH